MKNYSLTFGDDRFDIDIVPRRSENSAYELMMDEESLYILVPFPDNPEDMLKIFYPKPDYLLLLSKTKKHILWQFLFLTLIALLISLLFSFYVLKPLRESLQMLEIFIKDIIHDLNTPITSILINLKMMDSKNEEVESIGRSAKTIAMLHQNLDAYLKEHIGKSERFRLNDMVDEQVAFFRPMYDYLNWQVRGEPLLLYCDRHAFGRMLYNLLSNACKYNTSNGFVRITSTDNTLVISNSSYGIHSPERIFERFYKENERGLGIGLHIVQKLSEQLNIPVSIKMDGTDVHFHLDLSKVTSG